MSDEPDVLIVGGSLVGLSAALFLRLHGVSCLAVERHTSTAIHPRAGHFQLRTVEILRSAGLEDAVRRKGEEQYHPNGGINNVESLAGREIASYFANLNAGVEEFSPTVRLFIDQDALEPILRGRAEELGAQLRYRVECASLSQDASGVTATLRDLDGGTEETVRTRYVVAADGNRSPVREQLGIAMRGHGLLSNSITIYFRAEVDLAPLLEGRDQGVNYVTNPVLRGFFRLDRTGNRGFLVVNLVGDTARPEVMAAYPNAPWANIADTIDERRALELLRAAIGVPDIPVVIEDVATWRAVADSAERYQDGRVFLAGDAAHTMPPNGGFGGNTGVQDAFNLAWKLGLVVEGRRRPRAPRHLRRRTPPDRRADGRAGIYALRDPGRPVPGHRRDAAARRRLLAGDRLSLQLAGGAARAGPVGRGAAGGPNLPSTRASRRAGPARARRTCRSPAAARTPRRSTCSACATSCSRHRGARPGAARRWRQPRGSGCRSTRMSSAGTNWSTPRAGSPTRTGSPGVAPCSSDPTASSPGAPSTAAAPRRRPRMKCSQRCCAANEQSGG